MELDSPHLSETIEVYRFSILLHMYVFSLKNVYITILFYRLFISLLHIQLFMD
jgi:hypothetical protein